MGTTMYSNAGRRDVKSCDLNLGQSLQIFRSYYSIYDSIKSVYEADKESLCGNGHYSKRICIQISINQLQGETIS
jgi:hypothetical protein